MCKRALTPEERTFAEKHHRLVYEFLHKKHLSKDDYYDIVVFGYLAAVMDYSICESIRKYAFSTICWKYMSRVLFNHRRYEAASKRKGKTVSLNTGTQIPLEHCVPYARDLIAESETDLLLSCLKTRLSDRQMRIVQLKHQGYTVLEIAGQMQLSVNSVRLTLKLANKELKQICYYK